MSLEELLLLWQDQTITAEQLAELKKLLSNPEGRAKLAEDFFLTAVVLESLQTQKVAREYLENPPRLPADKVPTPVRPRLAWWAGALAGAAMVLLALGVRFWFAPLPSPALVPGEANFAQFEQVLGDTFVVSNEQKMPAQAGQALLPGQGIATEGVDSEAVVQMKDDVRLTLGGDTTIFTTTTPEEHKAGGPKVVLEQGDLLVQATRSLRKKKMTVQTPLGVAVTETEETALHVSPEVGVVVVRGEVNFLHKQGKSIRIKAGQYVVADPAGELSTAQLFSGSGTVWTTFPRSGLDTNSLGYRVVFSADGKWLAAVGRHGEGGVRFGPVEVSSSPLELRGERCVAFSPDSKLLATVHQGNILLYETANGKQLRVLTARDRRVRVGALTFSPDGSSLVVGRGSAGEAGDVEVWNVATGTLGSTWRGHSAGVTSLAFTPDGKLLASGSLDRTVILWDMSGREQSRIVATSALVVWSLAFSPNGKTLAIAAGPADFRLRQAGELRLWDLETRKERANLRGHTLAVTSVAFSSDGQTLISGSADTTVRFWELGSGREYGMLKGHKAAPGFEALMVDLAPNNTYLATASFDRSVKMWKTTWTKNAAQPRVSARADRYLDIGPWHSPLAFQAQP